MQSPAGDRPSFHQFSGNILPESTQNGFSHGRQVRAQEDDQ
jgi:hypothetical protein